MTEGLRRYNKRRYPCRRCPNGIQEKIRRRQRRRR